MLEALHKNFFWSSFFKICQCLGVAQWHQNFGNFQKKIFFSSWMFLDYKRRIEGVTLFNKVRSSEIQKSRNIEPLLLRIERSQLRWFGHVSKMSQERLPEQALLAKANGRRPVGRPRTRWTNYFEDLGWNRLGLRPSEMMKVMEDREVRRLNLELLPPQPSWKSGQWRKKKSNISSLLIISAVLGSCCLVWSQQQNFLNQS